MFTKYVKCSLELSVPRVRYSFQEYADIGSGISMGLSSLVLLFFSHQQVGAERKARRHDGRAGKPLLYLSYTREIHASKQEREVEKAARKEFVR